MRDLRISERIADSYNGDLVKETFAMRRRIVRRHTMTLYTQLDKFVSDVILPRISRGATRRAKNGPFDVRDNRSESDRHASTRAAPGEGSAYSTRLLGKCELLLALRRKHLIGPVRPPDET
jgi:hypothetical protein